VLDFGALNGARAEAHNVEAARLTFRSARDFVIHVAGNLFVQALAVSARADAARAQDETSRALHQQALDLKQGGLIAGIDVLRAEVQLSTQTQRSTIAVNEFEKAKLQLARAIGLPLGQRFALDPALPNLPVRTSRSTRRSRWPTRPARLQGARSNGSAPSKRPANRSSETRRRRCTSTQLRKLGLSPPTPARPMR
jgi:outer membrane protein TolC